MHSHATASSPLEPNSASMNDRSIPAYDVAVVGGGPAGLTTAIYTT